MCDQGTLQDALLNLIFNARDACGPKGQITVSAHSIAHLWIDIKISDTGPGFSSEVRKRAQNPFCSTKGGKGSGLGLPMVHDAVKLAGGDTQLSDTELGACITPRLPHRVAPTTVGRLAWLVEDSEDLPQPSARC